MSYGSIATIYDVEPHAGRELRTGSPRTPSTIELDAGTLESSYLELGALEGDFAGPVGRSRLRRRFLEHGYQGALWLLDRMQHEESDDTLAAAGSLLGHLAESRRAWSAIVQRLSAMQARSDQRGYVEALLRALVEAPVPHGSEGQVVERVRAAAADRDVLIRELGLRLAARLDGREVLFGLFEADPDPDLRELLAGLREGSDRA